jgi:hypothetical protein
VDIIALSSALLHGAATFYLIMSPLSGSWAHCQTGALDRYQKKIYELDHTNLLQGKDAAKKKRKETTAAATRKERKCEIFN